MGKDNKTSKVFAQSAARNGRFTNANINIETPRLTLREFNQNDIDRIHEISKNPKFYYYCFDGSRNKAAEFVNRAIDCQATDGKTGNREDVLLAIAEKDTGTLVGHIAIESVFYDGQRHYEINFFVDADYQNKGYGREAAISMMRFGLEDMGLDGYTVTTHPENHKSKHVILTEGYTETGTTEIETTNGKEPRIMFHLSKTAFYEQRKKDKRPMLLPRAPKP